MRRITVAALALALVSSFAYGQAISTPPSGDNQKSSVSQNIGLVKVTIDYSSPDVHAPNGDDRRGKIWGELVPWGLSNLGFGTCTECPWRAGANENTVFTVSHDVKVNGQPLPAGSYGVHMIPAKDEPWTLILSKNSTAWGSYTYDPREDALRVAVKPEKGPYREYLTYEFTERKPDRATVVLGWEDLQVPWTITVDNATDLHLAKIREELRSYPGFTWMNWVGAAEYALGAKRPADALEFATRSATQPYGLENFRTLSVLADAQEANGKGDEAKATWEKAVNHQSATAIDLHMYGRRLLNLGKKAEALRVFELNAKRNPDAWPVHVGLARGYSANGRFKQALKEAKLALAQAPDEINRKALADGIRKLEQGQDMN